MYFCFEIESKYKKLYHFTLENFGTFGNSVTNITNISETIGQKKSPLLFKFFNISTFQPSIFNFFNRNSLNICSKHLIEC